MFENKTFKNGTDEAYQHLCQLAENSDDAETFEEIKRLLDIDEFSNYMAVELFLGNDDWPENNVKAYRSQYDGSILGTGIPLPKCLTIIVVSKW